jgi:hypothetical protein
MSDQTLTLVPPPLPPAPSPRLSSSPPTKKDRARWYLYSIGKTEDEIVASEGKGSNTLKVRTSIQKMLVYQQERSREVVTMEVHGLALSKLDHLSKFVDEALVAKRYLADGKTLVPDWDVGLKALKEVREWLSTVQPKPGMSVNVNQQTNVVSGGRSGRSFETQLRERREARGLKNREDIVEGDVPEDDEDEEDTEYTGGDDDESTDLDEATTGESGKAEA